MALPALSRADYVIVQNVEGGPQTGEMTIKIKGDQIRADISPQMSSISNSATGDSIMIMHMMKSYMKISGESTKALMQQMQQMQQQMGAAGGGAAGGSGGEAAIAPKATGKTQRIGSYDTQEYVCQAGGINLHYWVAKDYPNWAKIQQQMLKSQENSLSKMLPGKIVRLNNLPGMPIKTELEFSGQKIAYTIVSVKEEEVSAKEFEIPAGYQEMAMPSFGGH